MALNALRYACGHRFALTTPRSVTTRWPQQLGRCFSPSTVISMAAGDVAGSGAATDLKAAKTALRNLIKERYKGQTSSSAVIASESETAQELVLLRPEYKQAQRIGIYLAMPSAEVQTATIIHDAFRNGKRVFVPYLYKPDEDFAAKPVYMKRVMDLVELESAREFEGLDRDKWGIPTLSAESVHAKANCCGYQGLSMKNPPSVIADDEYRGPRTHKAALDLLIMPGVAFDASCNRLGHGGGFYDNFIGRFTNREEGLVPAKWLFGLSLSGQMVEEVPVGQQDWKLDAVVVGDGRLVGRDGEDVSPETLLAPRDAHEEHSSLTSFKSSNT